MLDVNLYTCMVRMRVRVIHEMPYPKCYFIYSHFPVSLTTYRHVYICEEYVYDVYMSYSISAHPKGERERKGERTKEYKQLNRLSFYIS